MTVEHTGEWGPEFVMSWSVMDTWEVKTDGEHTITHIVSIPFPPMVCQSRIRTPNGETTGPRGSESITEISEYLTSGQIVEFLAYEGAANGQVSGTWTVMEPAPLPENAITPDQIDGVYVGAQLADALYRGDTLVWQALPVVTITGTSGTQSRDQFRQACIDHGTTYQTVQELPFLLDTSQATGLAEMFYGCSALTQVPDLDTSQATSMQYMFRYCSSLTQVPDLDTSQATSMQYMFHNCSSLTTVPDLDTSQATNMAAMFNGCSSLTTVPDLDTSQATTVASMFRNCSSLTDGNVRLIGRHPDVTTTLMISGSGLTREPWYYESGEYWPDYPVTGVDSSTSNGTKHTWTVPASGDWFLYAYLWAGAASSATISLTAGTEQISSSHDASSSDESRLAAGDSLNLTEGTVVTWESVVAPSSSARDVHWHINPGQSHPETLFIRQPINSTRSMPSSGAWRTINTINVVGSGISNIYSTFRFDGLSGFGSQNRGVRILLNGTVLDSNTSTGLTSWSSSLDILSVSLVHGDVITMQGRSTANNSRRRNITSNVLAVMP